MESCLARICVRILFYDPLQDPLNYRTGHALLNNSGNIIFGSLYKSKGSLVPYFQACGSQPTR